VSGNDDQQAPGKIVLPAAELSDAQMKERLAEYFIALCRSNGVDPKDLFETLREEYGYNK